MNKTVLIIAAHPDDEILGCGATIAKFKNDGYDIYLEIHAGAGGTESQDWADMLRRMYMKWFDKKKFKYEIISEHKGEEAGIKSSIIKSASKIELHTSTKDPNAESSLTLIPLGFMPCSFLSAKLV